MGCTIIYAMYTKRVFVCMLMHFVDILPGKVRTTSIYYIMLRYYYVR